MCSQEVKQTQQCNHKHQLILSKRDVLVMRKTTKNDTELLVMESTYRMLLFSAVLMGKIKSAFLCTVHFFRRFTKIMFFCKFHCAINIWKFCISYSLCITLPVSSEPTNMLINLFVVWIAPLPKNSITGLLLYNVLGKGVCRWIAFLCPVDQFQLMQQWNRRTLTDYSKMSVWLYISMPDKHPSMCFKCCHYLSEHIDGDTFGIFTKTVVFQFVRMY